MLCFKTANVCFRAPSLHLSNSALGRKRPASFECIDQGLQLHTTAADPGTQCGAGNGQTGTTKDGFLAVQRQMVSELGHQHLGQQTCRRNAFVDDVCVYWGLDQGLALDACPFAAHMALDTEDAGLIVQLLGDIFTDALHLAAASAGGGIGFVVDLHAGKIRWQWLAFGLFLDPYMLPPTEN